MPEAAVWAIFFLPLFSFVVISLVIRPFLNHRPQYAGYLTIGCIAAALGLSLWALATVMGSGPLPLESHLWVPIGDFAINLGLLVDEVTAIMLIVVTVVSLMVQIYSQGYMHGDPGYPRYFAFMSLFTASMLGLVLAGNLLLTYVFWEGVGLCSYLLIGFWFHRPSAAAAAKKAFIVTRLGDFGFLVAIIVLYMNVHTLDIAALPNAVHQAFLVGTMSSAAITWVVVGVFSGAIGKSAQFPLHTWLPDAMEGPTPVSALIHAATMVAAGVYLVARMFPLFQLEEAASALATVAVIGAVTAIFAASMGLVMNDIKRVLAYSTISQLGYMMLALGTGSLAVGMFHLFNHAFFKALLFLGAGSVNHATGTFDMRQMGGLRKYMPWTYITFLIASLAIAGIWPLSGFFSKDAILIGSQDWQHGPVLFYLAMITVFMTAFYMFRALFMTFGGEYRGEKASPGQGHGPHLHESPLVMVLPMVLLGVLAVISGWLPVSGFMHGPEYHGFFDHVFHLFTHPELLPWISLVVAGLGIFLAYAMYSARWLSPERVGQMFRALYTTFSRKYWFDELYEQVFVVRVLVDGMFRVLHLFDDYVVDGVVNGLANGTRAASGQVRKLQTGQLQVYGLAIGVGVLVIIFCFWIWG